MRVLGFLYAVLVFGAAVASALIVGTFAVLPFIVLPRGRRERYTMRTAAWWADMLSRGLLLARPTVTGTIDLPDEKGALFLCNHRSWLDPMLMIAWTRSQGLSKSQIFWIPFVGIYGWLTGAVFFNRNSFKQRKRARAETMWLIERGHRIHVFPEGTRSRDGTIASKVFLTLPRDCFAAGLPVVPCAVWGTERTLPIGAPPTAFPFQRSRLDIGEPLWPKDFPDEEAFAQACWAEVRRRVGQLEAEEQPKQLAVSA